MIWTVLSSALLTPGAVQAADFVYVVRPGDHLWNIAQRYLLRPTQALELLRRHHIPDEHRLMPGTRLHIPHDWLRLESADLRLAALVGEVRVQTGSEAERPAIVGEPLKPPARLRTGDTGSARLTLSDGSQVLVLRDSELQLRSTMTRLVDQAGMVTLELLRGGLENDVRPRQPQGGRFEIHTPAAIAAVRGTRFRVHADDGNTPQARTEVLSGAVAVHNDGGQVTAQAGQGSVTSLRQAPRLPVPLLPMPDLSGLPERVERLPADLRFPPLTGAQAYRVQVAPGPAFDVPLVDTLSTTPQLNLRELPDGPYRLSVRGIDARALEGLSAQRPVTVHTQPEPPLLIEPTSGAVTTAARPRFRWTEGASGTTYRLQLSRAGSFEPFTEQVVARGEATLPDALEPGDYQWRVASLQDQGQGPFSDAQAFRRVLPGPDAQSVVMEGGQFRLGWTAQPDVSRYRLQVAHDADFTQPVVDVTTEAPQFQMPMPAPGPHYVRVQTLDAAGHAGPWGSTQTFTVPDAPPSRWPLLLLLLPLVLL